MTLGGQATRERLPDEPVSMRFIRLFGRGARELNRFPIHILLHPRFHPGLTEQEEIVDSNRPFPGCVPAIPFPSVPFLTLPSPYRFFTIKEEIP